jgi:hypothetical protein
VILTEGLQAGPELDAFMAEEIMGWERNRGQMVPGSGETDMVWQDEYWKVKGHPLGGVSMKAWKPSTDIAAAWELWQMLTREAALFLESGPGAYCRVFSLESDFGELSTLTIAEANDAPLAICRAAHALKVAA